MTRGRRYFGTDGVRGIVGEDLTEELVERLGRAFALTGAGSVLVGRDTRASGQALESALARGIASGGARVWLGGVLPTPAVALLNDDMGAVISASHNPPEYNGVKFFNAGFKLSDEDEAAIEAHLDDPPSHESASIEPLEGLVVRYLELVLAHFGAPLNGLRVAVDCANGAMFEVAPTALERLRADVTPLANEPNGMNINAGCGATDLSLLSRTVRAGGFDLGVAFDGDGDRMLAVDSTGSVRDGDELIALVAGYLRRRGTLGGGVAVTVMSNYGFHNAMAAERIEVATTPVGDRHVSAELERRGWSLGGEQSGHLIWREYAPTGDGIAAALLAISALGGREMAEVRPMERLPQVLENVEVADRDAIAQAAALWEAVERESSALEGRGRVLVRASGTEPLVRVMVEAPEQAEADEVCARLVETVKRQLG